MTGWADDDAAVVKRAMQSASSFLQNHEGYYPAYQAQSGEIVGILKQLKEEMEGDLSDSQKKEQEAASSFNELRAAKTDQIESAEKMEEEKEDDLANSENALAEGHSSSDGRDCTAEPNMSSINWKSWSWPECVTTKFLETTN